MTPQSELELTCCPECGRPAEIVQRVTFQSTDGPVEHARTRCLAGHGFTPLAESLVAWPLERDRRPLGAGG
jgi:hypothetical protein